MDSRGEVWKMFVVLTPVLGAALVSGTRIMDARHHPFDVLSGALIGTLIAWAAYRQYFPSIGDFRSKGRAYSMRTWGQDRAALHQEENTPLKFQTIHDPEQPATRLVSNNWPSGISESNTHDTNGNRPISQQPLKQQSSRDGQTGHHFHGDSDLQPQREPVSRIPDNYELQPRVS